MASSLALHGEARCRDGFAGFLALAVLNDARLLQRLTGQPSRPPSLVSIGDADGPVRRSLSMMRPATFGRLAASEPPDGNRERTSTSRVADNRPVMVRDSRYVPVWCFWGSEARIGALRASAADFGACVFCLIFSPSLTTNESPAWRQPEAYPPPSSAQATSQASLDDLKPARDLTKCVLYGVRRRREASASSPELHANLPSHGIGGQKDLLKRFSLEAQRASGRNAFKQGRSLRAFGCSADARPEPLMPTFVTRECHDRHT